MPADVDRQVVERLLGDRHGYDQSNMAGEVAEHEREQDQRTQEPGTRANELCDRNQMRGTSRFWRRHLAGCQRSHRHHERTLSVLLMETVFGPRLFRCFRRDGSQRAYAAFVGSGTGEH